MAITEYIRNVDRTILNTVFENTVWGVNKCLKTGGSLWTLLVTFCIVIIRCTETFWSPSIKTRILVFWSDYYYPVSKYHFPPSVFFYFAFAWRYPRNTRSTHIEVLAEFPLVPWNRIAQIRSSRSPRQPFFLRCHLIIMYTQYRTPFVLLFWRLELWGGFWISGKVVHPFDKVTSRKWPAVYYVMVPIFTIWYLQSFCPMKVNVTQRETFACSELHKNVTLWLQFFCIEIRDF
jgi:hypothetical protein